jgi:hypothetical protein
MKELKQDIKNGMNKNDAFESFKNREREDVKKIKKASSYLAITPDAKILQRYSKANFFLMTIYALISTLTLLASVAHASSLPLSVLLLALAFDIGIVVVILYLLYKGNALAYLVLSFFMIRAVIKSIELYFNDPSIAAIVFLGIYIFIITFAIYLKLKLFPQQNLFNSKKDKEGNYIFE